MPIRLRPTDRQKEDLNKVATLTSEQIEQIRDKFEAVELTSENPLHLRPEFLVGLAKQVKPEVAEELVRQLLSLRTLARRYEASSKAICEAIGQDVGGAWQQRSDQFAGIMDTRAVRLTASAVELSYDYENLIRSVRILTDIRPLFDINAQNVEAAVVSHTMRVDYTSASGQHEFSAVLDVNDIRQLQKACERALEKSEASRRAMRNIPTVISGESEKE